MSEWALEPSQIPFPEDQYLALLGQAIYAHAYFEWCILGDLGRREIEPHLPAPLKQSELMDKTSGQVRSLLRDNLDDTNDPRVAEYLRVAITGLDLIVEQRNDIAHAKPVTGPNDEQMLHRQVVPKNGRPGKSFRLTESYLREAIRGWGVAIEELGRVRFPFDVEVACE